MRKALYPSNGISPILGFWRMGREGLEDSRVGQISLLKSEFIGRKLKAKFILTACETTSANSALRKAFGTVSGNRGQRT